MERRYMDRRIFMKFGCLTPGLFGMLAACGEKPEYTPLNVTGLDATREDSDDQKLYTAEEHPEELSAKVEGHLPQVTLVENQIQVLTPHPMDEEHHISRHQLLAASGEVIADEIFVNSEATEAKSLFRPVLPAGEEISALSTCNLHGIWKASFAIADLLNGFEDATIYTSEEPGRWAGKEAGHLPNVTMEGTSLLVTTEHGMSPEHYISKHQIRDENGSILGENTFDPAVDTETPTSKFILNRPSVGTSFKALSHCNLHGMWELTLALADFEPAFHEELIYTEENPGRWAGKEAGHLPTVTTEGSILLVTTEHAMTEEHYISKHQIIDETGKVLRENTFDPTLDTTAVSRFRVERPDGGSNFRVLSHCNLHGIWQREYLYTDFSTAFIENRIYTQDDPGQWEGKEAGHLPSITIDGLVVTITTTHVIGADHYIAKHSLINEAGETLAESEFDPAAAAESAVSTHTLAAALPASGLLKVYALCNLHGLWQRIVSIADIPQT